MRPFSDSPPHHDQLQRPALRKKPSSYSASAGTSLTRSATETRKRGVRLHKRIKTPAGFGASPPLAANPRQRWLPGAGLFLRPQASVISRYFRAETVSKQPAFKAPAKILWNRRAGNAYGEQAGSGTFESGANPHEPSFRKILRVEGLGRRKTHGQTAREKGR